MHLQIQSMLCSFKLHTTGALQQTSAVFRDLTLGFTILQPSCVGIVSFEHRYFLNISAPIMMLLFFLLTFALSRALNACVSTRVCQLNPGGVSRACSAFAAHRMDGDCLFSGFGMLMETFFVAFVGLSFGVSAGLVDARLGDTSEHVARGRSKAGEHIIRSAVRI